MNSYSTNLQNEKARGSNDIFLALGKFLLKLCNNARYEEENESRKLLNRTLDVLMPVYSGFCAGVIARVRLRYWLYSRT